jgi:hypothetical protein
VVTDSVYVPLALPIITDTNIFQNNCFGANQGSIELIPSNYPPTIYNWSNGGTTALNDSLLAASYSVIVSDARGCVDTLQFTITEPSQILVSSQVQNVLCNGNATGQIQLQAQGGNGGYEFWINDAIGSSVNSNLVAGIYYTHASDALGCLSATEIISITQPSSLSLNLSSTNEIIGLDGTATASVNGGTAPYTYLWNDPNSQPENMAVYLNSGWYTVVVTDANDCQISDSVFVDVTADLIVNQANTFLIYPNPAKENIQIVGDGKLIRIRDTHGKLIREMSFSNLVNIQNLSSGIYTVEIETETNIVKFLKFSKVE